MAFDKLDQFLMSCLFRSASHMSLGMWCM